MWFKWLSRDRGRGYQKVRSELPAEVPNKVTEKVPRGEQYIGRTIHDREQNNYRRLPLFDPGAAEAVDFLGVPCGGNNIFGQRGRGLRFDVKYMFFLWARKRLKSCPFDIITIAFWSMSRIEPENRTFGDPFRGRFSKFFERSEIKKLRDPGPKIAVSSIHDRV